MSGPLILHSSSGSRNGRQMDTATIERLRLFSPAVIVGFGLAVALGLVLVYPHRTLEQELLSHGNADRPDRLTVEYLKVFLKAEPKADGLRLALTQQLVNLGEFGEARKILQPLSSSRQSAVAPSAAWLEFEIREQEAFAAPADSSERGPLLARAREQMNLLIGLDLPTDKLVALGHRALAMNAPRIAAQAFRLVAARPEQLSPAFYTQAAEVSLGLGEYRTSAELYFRVMGLSSSLDRQRAAYLAGLRTLQAASLFDTAIEAADRYIGPLANDTETLLFLTRLAQAANRPADAERYAKRLLKLSMLQRLPQHRQQVTLFASSGRYQTPGEFYRSVPFQAIPTLALVAAHETSGPELPFDEQAYNLSFSVFLANGNVADARRLAQSAVRQQPQSRVWHKRLAEVSEWSGAPQPALAEWLSHARITGDEAAWNAALRLGESLFDQAAVREVLQHKLMVDGSNPKWLDQLLASYEAAGYPEQALALLHTRLFATGQSQRSLGHQERQRELELYALIAERSGADAESLDAYRQLQREFGPRSSYALHIANHLFSQGDVTAAFAALQPGLAVASLNDADFWRTYAEVARMLQDDSAAQTGYKKLLKGNWQNGNDLTNLIGLLEAPQPRAAAELAAFAYRATAKPEFALQALNLFARNRQWSAAQRFAAAIPAEHLRELEGTAAFLLARAAVRQGQRDLTGAEQDLRRGLALEPRNAELRASLIWLWMATHDTESVMHGLRAWQADAESDSTLWPPFAAAYLALNQPRKALHWFRKSGFVKDDYLWLMSYAECLDANAQPKLAWQIRRQAWLNLRQPALLNQVNPEQLLELRDRLAGLAPLFLDGDHGKQVIQALLQADAASLQRARNQQQSTLSATTEDGPQMLKRVQAIQAQPESLLEQTQENGASLTALFSSDPVPPEAGLKPDQRLSASAREVVLAYALSREENDLARAWLASRYATQLERPVWAELSLALAADDRQSLTRLLDEVPDWLPAYDRIEAAQRAGRPALAEEFAYRQLAQVGADDEAHLRLTNLVTEQPPSLQIDFLRGSYDPLQVRQTRIANSVALSPRLRLSAAWTKRDQWSDDAAALSDVPRQDNELEFGLRTRTETGYWMGSLQQRRNLRASVMGGRLDYAFTPSRMISINGSVGVNQRATESAALRALGMRSGAETSINYAFSQREYGRLDLGWYHYSDQQGQKLGAPLGTGNSWGLELGTRFRIEYPNLTLRAFVTGNTFRDYGNTYGNYGGPPISALPNGVTSTGISLGLGTVIADSYSRAWRPFLEVGIGKDKNGSGGYNISAGIAGSVFGADTLSLQAMRNRPTQSNPQGEQEIGFTYRWFY